MSVLANIANRLQTDLADTARAIVDVSFSEKLTNDQFNTRQFSRKAKAEREAAEADRMFRAEQAQQQRSWAAALDLGNKLFESALESNDTRAWNAYAEYATNENLPPELSSYFRNMNAAQGTKTLAQMKFDHQKTQDALNMTYKQRLAAVQEKNASINEARYFLEAEKQAIAELDATEERLREQKSAAAIHNFFATGSMVDASERANWMTMLEQGTGDYVHAKNVFDAYWKERHAQYANARNELDNKTRRENSERAAGRSVTDPLTVAANKDEVARVQAEIAGLVEKGFETNPQLKKMMENLDEASKGRVAQYVADRAKYLSRKRTGNEEGDILLEFVSDILTEEVASGIEQDVDGRWYIIDEPNRFLSSNVDTTSQGGSIEIIR